MLNHILCSSVCRCFFLCYKILTFTCSCFINVVIGDIWRRCAVCTDVQLFSEKHKTLCNADVGAETHPCLTQESRCSESITVISLCTFMYFQFVNPTTRCKLLFAARHTATQWQAVTCSDVHGKPPLPWSTTTAASPSASLQRFEDCSAHTGCYTHTVVGKTNLANVAVTQSLFICSIGVLLMDPLHSHVLFILLI